jgi:HSP20 family molecular chaperone IbpA
MTGNFMIPKTFQNFPNIRDEFFTPIESLFDSLMTEFFTDFKPLKFDSVKARAYPRVDAYRDKNDLVVEAAISNVQPENLKVELQNGMLTISGSADSRQEVESRCYYRTELFRSNFRRSFPIDTKLYVAWQKRTGANDDIDAELKNGILTVRLKGIFEEDTPTVESNPTRKIDIKVSDS